MGFKGFGEEHKDIEKLGAGEYRAIAIDFWDGYLDGNLQPVFKVGKDGQRGIMCAVQVEGQEIAPGYRLLPDDLGLLAHVFGVDPTVVIEHTNESRKLIALRDAISDSSKVVEVVVAPSGYVRYFKGMVPVEGHYRFRFDGFATRKDDYKVATWLEREPFGSDDTGEKRNFRLRWQILSGASGEPTPFDNTYFTTLLNYPINAEADGDGGVALAWNLTKVNQTPTMDAVRFRDGLWKLLAPTLFQGMVDGDEFPFTANEELGGTIDNILPLMEVEILKDNIIVLGRIKISERGFPQISITELTPVGAGAPVEVEEKLSPNAVEDIYMIIEQQLGGRDQTWEANGDFTPAAKNWLDEHVVPFWVDPVNEFPERRDFPELNEDQASRLFLHLQEKFALGDTEEQSGAF